MKITICGSMQFEPKMADIAAELIQRGYEVDKPNVVEGHVYADNLDANADLKRGFIDEHFVKIDSSDAILVVNEEKKGIPGYIGGNTLIEISHAYAQGLDIFVLNRMPELGYADEIRGMLPIMLEGEITKVDEYVAELPLLMMSTESELKHAAASRAMRQVGIPVRVEGIKIESGVNEQPLSVDETYDGAMNRQTALKAQAITADYYATIESGQHEIHENYSMFGCSVIVLEKSGEEAHVGIDVDIEFPQEMLDKVPSEYPDLGVLVQNEYGAVEKDPIPYLTGGKLTRRNILEKAFYKVAIRLENKA